MLLTSNAYILPRPAAVHERQRMQPNRLQVAKIIKRALGVVLIAASAWLLFTTIRDAWHSQIAQTIDAQVVDLRAVEQKRGRGGKQLYHQARYRFMQNGNAYSCTRNFVTFDAGEDLWCDIGEAQHATASNTLRLTVYVVPGQPSVSFSRPLPWFASIFLAGLLLLFV
jgi:hypothetical protein